jgi:DNA-binding MarR family transcriptional regulator
LDTVVKLEKRESLNLAVAEGACFDIKFTKLRGENPKPISLVAALTANEKGHLFWKHEEDQKLPAYMKVMQGIHDYKPTTQTALADKLKCTRQHVSEQVKICVEKGLVSKQDLSLTPKGVGVMAPVIQAAKKYANDL